MSQERSSIAPARPAPHRAPARSLDTAILVTAEAPSALLLADVAGLPLFVRAILGVQRARLKRLVLLTGNEADACRRMLGRHRRISLAIQWMPVREFPPGEPKTWKMLAAETTGSLLVVHPLAVFSPHVVELIRKDFESVESTSAPFSGSAVSAAPCGASGPVETVLLAIPFSLLGSLLVASGGAQSEVTPVNHRTGSWLDPLLDGPPAEAVRTLTAAPHLCCRVHSASDLQAVERRLLVSPKSETEEFDGWADTYLNRPSSRLLTRLFLNLRFSPNAVTTLSIALGLIAAAAFARGSYASGILGALLFQLSAIVDCCDGEVARLTFSESRLGAQLDLIGDNLVHVAVFAGVAWAVYLHGPTLAAIPPMVPLLLGAAVILANVLSLWLIVRARKLRDTDRFAATQTARVNVILRKVANRDFSVLLLLFALVGWLEPFLWLAAIGSNVFWLMLAFLTRPSALRALKPRA
jgi:1L-myo-inositol 1-phosphate cytidylyltransferase / CDP-L-myo-inositol myo-inositolphosphotransferase